MSSVSFYYILVLCSETDLAVVKKRSKHLQNRTSASHIINSVMKMKVLIPALLLAAGVWAAEDDSVFFRSTLPPPQKTYKFLFLPTTSFISHLRAYHPLMVALANRGHKVVLLSEPFWTNRNPNVTYLDHSAKTPGANDFPFFTTIENPLNLVRGVSERLEQSVKLLFNDPVVQSLYKTRKEFDLIIMDELMFWALYPFVHETTFAMLSVATIHQYGSAALGNPLNPAFVSSSIEEFPQPYSTWHRFKNCFTTLAFYLSYRYVVPHLAATEISSRFPSVPPPHEVIRNASLYMFFSDFTFEGVYPTLPLVVPIAGLSFQPTKPLPKDISEFLDGETPALFFSTGTTFGGSSQIPKDYKEILFSVFSKLPYKILMKFDEQPSQNYKNLFIRKFFPQQDVLAHPNVRACISHGGLQTVHEAIRSGVPILGMPYLPEHRRLIQGQIHRGQGLILEWSDLSEQNLNESITEIMENSSYREKMAETSRIFKDQRESPLDRAVYWTEYVAKYRGAPHLQSPAKHLTWIEIFNVDVIALLIFIAYVLLRLQIWFLKKLIVWGFRKWRTLRSKQKVH